jgi:hypothetical protein
MRLQRRRSVDLDLFRAATFDADAMVADLLAAGIKIESVQTARATVHGLVEGVRTSLLFFPYPLLEAPDVSPEGVPVAGLRDIAAMKIEAVASRGARKDFYDLYFMGQAGLGLADALKAFQERFASARPDLYHRLRALTYFDDAEREPEPLLLHAVDWATVRRYFVEEAKRIWAQG